MAKASVLLTPGGAVLPDGTAGNAAPALQRTKSTAAAPSLHFKELLFDPDTDEMCYWVFRCPTTYQGSVVVKIQWKANAVLGDVVWAAAVAAITPADVDTPNEKALAAASTVTTTVNLVEARRLVESSITIANLDGLAAGDFLALYVGRDADNVADTCLVDAEMVEVNVEFDDLAAAVYTSAYAAPPADPRVGDEWAPSDSFYRFRWNGALWVPWGPSFPMTQPVDGDFAWDNQDGTVKDITKGGINLYHAADAASELYVRYKAAPATPYTIKAKFLATLIGNNASCGLLFRQSADGKICAFRIAYNSGAPPFTINVEKWTNSTTYTAAYLPVTIYTLGVIPLILLIADDGVNRICSLSADGQFPVVLHSVGRADFLTADQVGFAIGCQSAIYGASITLVSWEET